MQMSVASVTISDVPRCTPAKCFLQLASVRPNYCTRAEPSLGPQGLSSGIPYAH
jgi:hypothetical protein